MKKLLNTNWIVLIYSLLILFAIYYKQYVVAMVIILTIPVAVIIGKQIKQAKIEQIKAKIKEAEKAHQNGQGYTPFINVNKENWYIIELIPGIERVTAKRIANYVRNNPFKTFNEFANFSGIEPVIYELIQKIIFF